MHKFTSIPKNPGKPPERKYTASCLNLDELHDCTKAKVSRLLDNRRVMSQIRRFIEDNGIPDDYGLTNLFEYISIDESCEELHSKDGAREILREYQNRCMNPGNLVSCRGPLISEADLRRALIRLLSDPEISIEYDYDYEYDDIGVKKDCLTHLNMVRKTYTETEAAFEKRMSAYNERLLLWEEWKALPAEEQKALRKGFRSESDKVARAKERQKIRADIEKLKRREKALME